MSPEFSTPSYICEIEAQFNMQPLPNFQLLNAPDTFELSVTYQAYKEESPELLTPSPISISPNVYKSLIDQMAQDTIHEDTPMDDHPGNGWEPSFFLSYHHHV